ncbi:hypothetical protein MUA90_12255 [Staphylococcus sp. IVB6181]|uniref:hypothetical protein n=1 Tax=Staphylococcus sp. IVB6181 TaxID=2929481 RepID=UPI0021D00312|nr:hypothetical protein [Staphylococcus sp. IVB6181]UXV34769.1 hypothetical protein MUA90_12255 [Staphylococcus sp. IVB6181]
MSNPGTVADGRYAEYQGEVFRVLNDSGKTLHLVTEDTSARALGFEAKTTKHSSHTLYYKDVARHEVEALYDLKHEARYGGTLFDLYFDMQGQSYMGTSDVNKAEAFGLTEKDEGYFSKAVNDDEYEPVIYREELEI